DAPTVHTVRGPSRQEAAAFVATAVEQTRPELRAVRVTSEPGWRHSKRLSTPLLVVIDMDMVEPPDVSGSAHVIAVTGSGDAGRTDLVLARLRRDKAQEAFAAAGIPMPDADNYAVSARRSLSSLRRNLAAVPTPVTWARGADSYIAAPL